MLPLQDGLSDTSLLPWNEYVITTHKKSFLQWLFEGTHHQVRHKMVTILLLTHSRSIVYSVCSVTTRWNQGNKYGSSALIFLKHHVASRYSSYNKHVFLEAREQKMRKKWEKLFLWRKFVYDVSFARVPLRWMYWLFFARECLYDTLTYVAGHTMRECRNKRVLQVLCENLVIRLYFYFFNIEFFRWFLSNFSDGLPHFRFTKYLKSFFFCSSHFFKGHKMEPKREYLFERGRKKCEK